MKQLRTGTTISHIGANLLYLHAIRDERPKCNPHFVTFARRLAKTAQTAQNKRAPGNDAIVAMTTLTSRKRLLLGVTGWRDFA